MRFSRPPRAKFDHVVVTDDERNHPQQEDVLRTLREEFRLEAHAAQQELLPLLGSEPTTSGRKCVERASGRQLNRPDALDREWSAVRLNCDRRVVLELDLPVEATGEHPLVPPNVVARDPRVLNLEA